MLVQSVLNLISDLQHFKRLTSKDVQVLESLIEHMESRFPEEPLTVSDIVFLLNCFKARWKEDSEQDYMLNPGPINQRWIDFAVELAPATDKNYLQILLPTITNTIDFNNITALTETVRLQNFYLGYNNKTLYRKRGLCERLISKNYILSTCRALDVNKECAVTIEELARLQSCRQKEGQFSIGEEPFNCFWDFLRTKVFPCLQSRGEMSLDLLPHLLIMIEKYHVLKEHGASYKLFKEYIQKIFKRIYSNTIDNINFFYGIEIYFKGKSFYLLDFLIVISKAESYVLDEHLNALLKWLYNYNPVLKSTNVNLEIFYENLQREATSLGDDLPDHKSKNSNLLTHCLNFLLSLFTIHFDFIPLIGKYIRFWDISRWIFAEACEIFSLFIPALTRNKTMGLVEQYKKAMEKYIIPTQENLGFFAWITRYQSIYDWYYHARNQTLSKIGVNWFAPELILHTLLRYKTCSPVKISLINNFIDELIHTYTQEGSELQQQLRVNILFSEFLNNFSLRERRYINLLIQLQENLELKKNFLNDCVTHIVNRLSQISATKEGGSLYFFSDIRKADITKLDISTLPIDHLKTIIEGLKARIDKQSTVFDKKLTEKMRAYLRSISLPILSIKEMEEAKSGANTLDYLGAPT